MPSDSQSRNSTSMPAAPNPFEGLIGQTLDGRYHVKKILGQGGMGVVFQATQISMNRDVALKMLHPTLSVAPAFAERFRREAEVVSRLKHPNIISIFDFGQSRDGAFYYTMELLEGENLKALIKRDGPMTVRRAVEVTTQIADALGYAHGEGILHRDMKPHNVMCARSRGRDHCKVLDFGLVKMVDEEGNEDHLTTTGQILGTPAYMSPEQAGGDPLDARSDLYSLGVVLYYLLAGSTPFRASSANKLLQQAASNEIPEVDARRQGAPIPAGLQRFLRYALAFDRDARPENVDVWMAELSAALEGVDASVLDAVPTGAVAPAPEQKTGVTSNQRSKPSRMSGVHPAEAPSSSKAAVIGGAVGLGVLALAGGAFFALRSQPPTPQPLVVVAPPKPSEPAADPKPDPKPEARPAAVIVQVDSEPAGAQVFDGDKLLGVAPTQVAFDRSRGAVNVTFKLAGYLPQTQAVDLSAATPILKARLAAEKVTAKPKKPKSDDGIQVFE